MLELTYNWDKEDYGSARNFGPLAFLVDDIYSTCAKLKAAGVTINRPPRDGHTAKRCGADRHANGSAEHRAQPIEPSAESLFAARCILSCTTRKELARSAVSPLPQLRADGVDIVAAPD